MHTTVQLPKLKPKTTAQRHCFWFSSCSEPPPPQPQRPVSSCSPWLSSHRGRGLCKRTHHGRVIQSPPPTVALCRGVSSAHLSSVPLWLWGLISCPFQNQPQPFAMCWKPWWDPLPGFQAFKKKQNNKQLIASITKSFFQYSQRRQGVNLCLERSAFTLTVMAGKAVRVHGRTSRTLAW